MNHFRTVVSPGASAVKIGISDKIFTIGSCFADTMGSKLISNKLSVAANPFGILYNPHSIHQALKYALFNELPAPHTFTRQQDVHLNYNFHSEISSLQSDKLHLQLKEVIGTSHDFLSQARWLIITFGTAWVYKRKDTAEIVANCHKMPAQLFSKSLLKEPEIITSFDSLYQELLKINPGLRIILTVSPVRHLKDTLELNNVSKSILRSTCFTLSEKYADVEYFPAYEIMMDDLRDYRFYKEDMIHPSEVAEEYIWQTFATRYFSQALSDFVEQWKKIQHSLAHRPFHTNSAAHQTFLKETLKKLEDLKEIVNVNQEIVALKSQLTTTRI
jgi:GSCFA family